MADADNRMRIDNAVMSRGGQQAQVGDAGDEVIMGYYSRTCITRMIAAS